MQFDKFSFPSRRSSVIARQGMVATSQPLAAQSGLDILRRGGNAVDAAIATAAALCVTEPGSTGLGGDAFALIWKADESALYGLNASGPAPSRMTAEMVRNLGYEQMPELGGLPVTVPGSVRGWQLALERFGSMGLDTVLDRAITYARRGFPVSQRIAREWASGTEKLNSIPDSRRVWLSQGRAPNPAEIFCNRELANTLETVADQGYDAFYKGDIADQIVNCVQAAGGTLQEDDMATYEAEWVEPIRLDYRDGVTFHEIPPNGQGLTALLALNIVQGFDLGVIGYGTADYYHTLIEAMKLAFADASAFIADPRQAKIPVAALLSEGYAAERRDLLDGGLALLAGAGRPQQHEDTVYLTVADGDGNMVSWIQSLYLGFGSGLTAGMTGVLLQNRGANFSLQPGHPNELAPGKQPYHTIIPGFITRDDQAWCSYGVMGGFMQPQGHLQVGVNLVDFEMDPQTALDAPRFRWLKEKEVALEACIGDSIAKELTRRGHKLAAKDADVQYGGGQVIIRDLESGVLVGGSEPRKDGMAVGW